MLLSHVVLLLWLVAPALQASHQRAAMVAYQPIDKKDGGNMFARMMIENRFLGFDAGDWTMLFGGLTLAGFLALLV